MPPSDKISPAITAPLPAALTRLGCVSFLNSKPLIDSLVHDPALHIHFAVPSSLLALMESQQVGTALMSVVDFQISQADLLLVSASMIGCDGPTLTVRLFSRVPISEIKTVHADTDSHTSVILAQVILRERYHIAPPMIPLEAEKNPDTMLLIGDKVVSASPSDADYVHQLDLGEEWKKLTGLPFVFAMWMMRRDAAGADPAGALDVARRLSEARRNGATKTEQLLDTYAAEKHWPRDLARRYFTEYLRYEVTAAARQGLARFFELAARLKLLPTRRPIEYLDTFIAAKSP